MKIYRFVIGITFSALLGACGGGDGGAANNSPAVSADFAGTWSGMSGTTPITFQIGQTGNVLSITRTVPAVAGITYTGTVNGDSALVTTFANGISAATSTFTKTSNTSIGAVVNSCTPPTGFFCAAPGTTLVLTKVQSSALSFPLDAAYTKAVVNGVSLSGTAVDGADTWTLTVSLAPASDEAFEGVVRKKAIQSLTLKKNGAVQTATSIQGYYSLNPFSAQGARYSDGTYAVQTSTTGSFAVAAKVGDSGSLGVLTVYTSSSKSSIQSTTESIWTLEADTATTTFGCVNSIIKNAAGTPTGTAAGCYKIDTNGNALGMRYTLSVAGKTLVFK
ncbi:hypothetical protein [Polaromonas sp. DSR2-3-2]|uniref:hypothetical protein n=1 Tax=unclassified Polaromonas TaxID=2638319 RepID=UPI003CE6F91D